MKEYNVIFDQQGRNAGDSMPLGGHDVGCNVWVENNQLLVYMAQSGAFDEAGNMMKAGRLRIELSPNPYTDSFSQELNLMQGCINIVGKSGAVTTTISLWVDVFSSTLHIEMFSSMEHEIMVSYENWRTSENGYQNPDYILPSENSIQYFHQNKGESLFDRRIREEGLGKH